MTGDGPTEPHDVWTTRAPGTYLLCIRLVADVQIEVGRLGRFPIPAGWYVYVGSALGGLGARLRRHARTEKPRHWHVDALRGAGRLVAVAVHVGPERLECEIAATVAAWAGAAHPIPRFGASDCRCPSHLLHFQEEPTLQPGPDWLVVPAAEEAGARGASG